MLYCEIVKRGWGVQYSRERGSSDMLHWVDRNMISGLSYGKSSRNRRSLIIRELKIQDKLMELYSL